MSNRSRGAYDLTFESDALIIGFQLAAPAVPFEMSPGRLDETVRNADVPRIIDDLGAGMGFSRRISGAPTNGYSFCLPGYTRSPGGIFSPAGKVTEITLPPTSGAGSWVPAWIITSVRWRDLIYLITNNNYVLHMTAPTTATLATVLPAGFAGSGAAVFQNRLYIAGSTGLTYINPTGSVGPLATGVIRKDLAVASWRPLGVPTDVLVGTSSGSSGQWDQVSWCPSTGDPMTPGDWSAPVTVGADRRYSINALVAAPRHVYMLRPDGVYDMDELGARAFNIAPWVEHTSDYFNGGWGMHLGDGLYYQHAYGLAFVPTAGDAQYHPQWCHPGWGLPYEGPVGGMGTAGTLHAGYGLVAMNGDYGYICAGRRDERAYGAATHTWHGAEAMMPGYVGHMRSYTMAWTGDQPKLLIITNHNAPTASRAFWQSLPRTGSAIQEIVQGGTFEPADAASLFLPADPWDRPSSAKQLLQFDMLTERLTASDTLSAYARADEETAWTAYGTADAGAYSSWAPVETTEGRYISARVDAVGHPILRSLELRSAVGVELREARRYTVILAWDNALRGARGRETADPERRLADLQSLLGRVCTMDDAASPGTRRVRVLQVLPGARRPLGGAARAGSKGSEGAWAVTAEVMVSILDRPFRYDGTPDVDRFDSDRVWI